MLSLTLKMLICKTFGIYFFICFPIVTFVLFHSFDGFNIVLNVEKI